MVDVRKQVVTGLVPPQQDEAIIRERWPSVAASPLSGVGLLLMKTYLLAPLGWLVMAVPYFKKVLPFLAVRYTLTNRRLMIRRGLKRVPAEQVPLADIDEVRIQPGSFHEFFRAGNVEVVSQGKVVLTLPAVPGPDAFCQSIRNACMAWHPRNPSTPVAPAPKTMAK
jgi:hypothetical protein